MPVGPNPQITMRGVASDLTAGLFWLLAISTLINFHHIANMVFPAGWFVTAGLLAICAALLALAPVGVRQVLGSHGICMVAALASYAVIAAIVATITGVPWQDNDPYLALRPWFSILVIAGTATGTTAVLRRVGAMRLMVGILVLQGLAAALILASPWLIENVYGNLSASEYGFFRSRRTRYIGTFVNPIPAGMAACSAVVIGLAVLGHLRELRYRVLGGVVVVVGSIGVALTLARTAAVTLAVILIGFLLAAAPQLQVQRRHWGKLKVFLALFVGLLVLAVIYRETFLVSYNLVDRFLGLVQTPHREGLGRRLALLQHGLGIVTQAPLFGNGLSTLSWMHGAGTCQSATIVCGIHNSFLQYWGEAGLLPALLLLAAFALFFANAWRRPRSLARDVAIGWTFVFVMACLVADGIPYFLWHSFLFGMSCALLAHGSRLAGATAAGPRGPPGT